MKYILKIFLIVLLVVAIIGAACWFFLVQRPDLTMSVFAYWGDHFYDAGRYNRAVSLYETACRLDPQNANLPVRLAQAYINSGNLQDYPQIAYRWFRKGYVIQANKGSFLGRFGGGPKRAADSLLRHNLISVIASDAHSPLQRTPYMMDVYEELSREYSENHLDVLFQYNPARICDNREILRLEPVPYSGRQQLY